MRASVIVSTIHSQHVLISCLQSVCAQSVSSSDYEVLIPIFGRLSREDQAMLLQLQRQYPHLKVVTVAGMNRAEAINEAARQARGELLVFIESHCIAYPGWVADYLRLFEQDSLEVAAGAAPATPSDSWVSRCEKDLHTVVLRRWAAQNVSASFLDFHNTAMRRACFTRFGGLAADIPMMAEFELGARLHQAGTEIVRFPECVVHHFNDTKLRSYIYGVMEQGRNRARIIATRDAEFVQRYFPSRRFRTLLPLIRRLRRPLLGLTGGLLCVAVAGFEAARRFGSYPLALFFFRWVAEQSHLFGQIQALAERRAEGVAA